MAAQQLAETTQPSKWRNQYFDPALYLAELQRFPAGGICTPDLWNEK